MANVEEVVIIKTSGIILAALATVQLSSTPKSDPHDGKWRVLVTALTTCEACANYHSVVDTVSKQLQKTFIFKTINCDSSEQWQALCNNLEVEAVPTTIVFDQTNHELCRTRGWKSSSQLKAFLLQCVKTKND